MSRLYEVHRLHHACWWPWGGSQKWPWWLRKEAARRMKRGAIVSRLEHLFFIGMSIFDIYIPQEKMNVKKGRLKFFDQSLVLGYNKKSSPWKRMLSSG
jgi:hypothetical protein